MDVDVSADSSDYSSIISDTPVSNKTMSPKILSPITPRQMSLYLNDDNNENRNINLEEL